ncbi:toxic anion resistance protein [Novosphingobium sp. G106]|uniref:toxic anion resistance protein n=1 Tax=Novosphingobium sp. G106 TaxID=2849500 RepID=UPI001C2DC81C|nr:toxic anion resistance protein [Novosphingobium sp. G106]MBV1688185.1 toxic anion resistance protein [Novosphingobium sp. G106]
MTLPSQITTAVPIDLSADLLVPHVDPQEVEALASSIDTRSALTVAQFGHAVGETTSRYADQLLARARADDLDEIGGKLSEIVVAAQAFDLSSYDSKWTRAPIVGGLVRNFVLTKEKAMARFSSLEGQVDKLVANIQGTLDRLAERAASFDTMYDGVAEEHRMLATHVQAAQLVLERLDREITAVKAEPQDMASVERISALEGGRNALEKRIGDLNVLQHSALQTLPMIRMMQANNVILLEKFQTIQRLTLPAWKRTFVLALTLNEQREAVKLAGSIDDATNYFMKRNSEILHENAVATAAANQRLVVDVETLREVHDNVIKTLVDVRKAHEEGAAKRRDALAQLAQLRGEMAGGLANVLPVEGLDSAA